MAGQKGTGMSFFLIPLPIVRLLFGDWLYWRFLDGFIEVVQVSSCGIHIQGEHDAAPGVGQMGIQKSPSNPLPETPMESAPVPCLLRAYRKQLITV